MHMDEYTWTATPGTVLFSPHFTPFHHHPSVTHTHTTGACHDPAASPASEANSAARKLYRLALKQVRVCVHVRVFVCVA